MIATPEHPTVQTLQAAPKYEAEAAETITLLKERGVLSQTLTERRGWFGVGHRMPRAQARLYRKRLADIDEKLGLHHRLAAALAAGYDPYTPNPKMYVGYMSGLAWRPLPQRQLRYGLADADERHGGAVLEFNAPMPPDVLDAYEKARASGLFRSFLVASYDASQFRVLTARPTPEPRPAWYWLEPVLIGCVDEPRRVNITSGSMGATHGFMIAQWDLSAEIKLIGTSSPHGM